MRSGVREQHEAWLYRVARNRLIDELRRSDSLTSPLEDENFSADENTEPHFENEIADDELRMLFVCCDESIPIPSQLVLALKILCGFSTQEIALRLLTTEDNVQKRLSRGRERLRELDRLRAPLELQALLTRRPSVLRVIYLLFNEGYSSSLPDQLIRRELRDEAIRLGRVLAAHPVCSAPECHALLALMYLHASRFDARVDGNGALLLLEDQDRSRWDHDTIREGLSHLNQSARGTEISRYHAEAAIAAMHCTAPSYAETNWPEIVALYETLEKIDPSPLYVLNRAIALAEWKGPEAGLAELRVIDPPGWLARYYLWDATIGELERRAGNFVDARRRLGRALLTAPHPQERKLIARRLAACPP